MVDPATVKPTTAGASAASAGTKPTTKPATAGGNARLEALAKTLEFKWFVSHAFVVLNTIGTLVFFRFPKLANFTYRVGFLAAFASFAVILYQTYGRSKPTAAVLIRDDNFQYVVATLFWLVTPRHVLALLPLSIFSLFHVLTFTRSYLLPAVGHPADSPLIKKIDALVKNYNEPLTVLAANFELALAVQLLVLSFTFRKGSWLQLVFYVLFFRIRYATSAYTRHAVKAWEVRVDQLLGHPSLPPKAKQVWADVKTQLAKIPGPANKA